MFVLTNVYLQRFVYYLINILSAMISRRISYLIYLSIFDSSELYLQFLLLIYYSYIYID